MAAAMLKVGTVEHGPSAVPLLLAFPEALSADSPGLVRHWTLSLSSPPG